jgi:addiction module HigA family antidote
MKTAITPGEILLGDYLMPMGISQNALARALGISPRSINEIVLGHRSITPEMSLKLGKFFKQSAQFWFNIQTTCDFRQLLKKEKQITATVSKDYTELAASDQPSQRIC